MTGILLLSDASCVQVCGMSMEQPDNVILMNQHPCGWSKLIRQLRSIGMTEQARRLDKALRELNGERKDRARRRPPGSGR